MITHEHVGPYVQAFLCNAVVDGIGYDVAIGFSGKNICPAYDGEGDKVEAALVVYLVAGAHNFDFRQDGVVAASYGIA